MNTTIYLFMIDRISSIYITTSWRSERNSIIHLFIPFSRSTQEKIFSSLYIIYIISLLLYLFFRKAIIYQIRCGIIEIERIHPSWEEFSQIFILVHLSKYLIDFIKPLFLGILFIENAERFVF